MLVTMFTVFEDVLSYAGLLMLDLELSCSLLWVCGLGDSLGGR